MRPFNAGSNRSCGEDRPAGTAPVFHPSANIAALVRKKVSFSTLVDRLYAGSSKAGPTIGVE
ncbi:hypothetical protein [Rhodococcus sp. Leaf278]|uniref:hypothetical protein n=1 Tax=Rhodococcus sp. Leaf278 TaxID=1736319 RepID=UPI000B1AA143